MSEPTCPGCTQRNAVIATLLSRIATPEEEVAKLKARLGQTASNSSIPLSVNPPLALPPVLKKTTGRKQGGQTGYRAHHQVRLPAERVNHVIPLIPSHCERCQTPLGQPSELQGHARSYPCGGPLMRGSIPAEISSLMARSALWHGLPAPRILPAL
jgi:hypothetical protein